MVPARLDPSEGGPDGFAVILCHSDAIVRDVEAAVAAAGPRAEKTHVHFGSAGVVVLQPVRDEVHEQVAETAEIHADRRQPGIKHDDALPVRVCRNEFVPDLLHHGSGIGGYVMLIGGPAKQRELQKGIHQHLLAFAHLDNAQHPRPRRFRQLFLAQQEAGIDRDAPQRLPKVVGRDVGEVVQLDVRPLQICDQAVALRVELRLPPVLLGHVAAQDHLPSIVQPVQGAADN